MASNSVEEYKKFKERQKRAKLRKNHLITIRFETEVFIEKIKESCPKKMKKNTFYEYCLMLGLEKYRENHSKIEMPNDYLIS